jgi:hypothetical protein
VFTDAPGAPLSEAERDAALSAREGGREQLAAARQVVLASAEFATLLGLPDQASVTEIEAALAQRRRDAELTTTGCFRRSHEYARQAPCRSRSVRDGPSLGDGGPGV